jgi:hypothetical protein
MEQELRWGVRIWRSGFGGQGSEIRGQGFRAKARASVQGVVQEFGFRGRGARVWSSSYVCGVRG